MKARILLVSLLVMIVSVPMARALEGQSLGLGVFLETRTENKISGSELSFDYTGLRVTFRDDVYLDGFLDMGNQSFDLDGFDADDAGTFGLGGTLWLSRSDDNDFFVDFGLYGSYYVADYEVMAVDSGLGTDLRHNRYLVQGVISFMGNEKTQPYIRFGMQSSDLDVDTEGVITGDDLKETKPAINVGLVLDVDERVAITLEGNYSHTVGGAARLDYWF